MGLLQELASHPLAQQFQEFSLGKQIGIGFGGFIILSVVLNVLSQILFRNPNEPPMVFHWFPWIGSTITYGMDPPTFFKENRAKVSLTNQSVLGTHQP
jgi:sterol 14-demethylase